ncbi:MAG TPA: low-complexity protein [Gammaproteobacteria bacterium]|nr:low-complexity protein [Gammaproteobacteria bacterium]
MLKKSIKPVSLAAGLALVGSLASVSVAQADANPFGMSALSSGYMAMSSHGGDKEGEGKCGEGKCGEDKDKEGEGKCGADKEGEGKCGEGKCGEDKKGEGKCGGDLA